MRVCYSSHVPYVHLLSSLEIHMLLSRECDDAEIKNNLKVFGKVLWKARKQYNKPTISNPTPRQWKMASTLKNHDVFMAVERDKNFGGCLIHPHTYIDRGIREHLGDMNVYQPLPKPIAQQQMCVLRYKYNILCQRVVY